MSRRPSPAWIAPPVVAAALTLPALVALAAGGPTPGPGTPAGTAWMNPMPVTACPAGAARPVPRDGRPATPGAAWTLAPLLAANGALDGWELVAAQPGSRPASLRLPAEAGANGPVGGLVAVTADDGSQSTISLVSAADGCRRVVHRDADVVRSAVVEPGSGAILFHLVRRTDRADLGVHRVGSSDGQPAVRVLDPVAPDDSIRAAVGRIWSTLLQPARDGGLLAVQSCGAAACRTRLVNLMTGEMRVLPARQGPLVGLDGRLAVTFQPCAGLPCPLMATDLTTGDERQLSEATFSAATTRLGDRLIVAAVVREHEGRQLVAIDPADGSRVPVPFGASSLALLVGGAGSSAGLEAAPGSVPAADERDGRPFAIDLASLLVAAEVSK